MECHEKVTKNVVKDDLISKHSLKEYLFIDIEATGFSKETDKIFSIAIGYFDEVNNYIAEVLFEEEDELALLKNFKNKTKNKKKWCTFNGRAFDEPFLQKRLEINNLKKCQIEDHKDFYRIVSSYRKGFKLKGLSLKNVEEHLGIKRKDEISGEECKDLYFKFIESKNEEIKNFMLLHNLEDVLFLPKFFYLLEEVEEKKLKRDDLIYKSQIKLIKYLIDRRNPNIKKVEFSKISRKEAARIIYHLRQTIIDEKSINLIIDRNK